MIRNIGRAVGPQISAGSADQPRSIVTRWKGPLLSWKSSWTQPQRASLQLVHTGRRRSILQWTCVAHTPTTIVQRRHYGLNDNSHNTVTHTHTHTHISFFHELDRPYAIIVVTAYIVIFIYRISHGRHETQQTYIHRKNIGKNTQRQHIVKRDCSKKSESNRVVTFCWREWTRPLRVLAVQCSLQTIPIQSLSCWCTRSPSQCRILLIRYIKPPHPLISLVPNWPLHLIIYRCIPSGPSLSTSDPPRWTAYRSSLPF